MRYELFAPAKINLDLTITGVRDDGYHTLRSHVAFADCGDELTMDISTSRSLLECGLSITGPFAQMIDHVEPQDNLITKAISSFSTAYDLPVSTNIHLTKNLPSSAGMGGGSADAAAILRGLVQHFAIDDRTDDFQALCLSLGADVPVCYHAKPCLMEGIGEVLNPWATGDAHAVLIWPGTGASTKDLYAAYDAQENKVAGLANDFLPVASQFCPSIQNALVWLNQQPGCLKTGLTGSGTTVFGLFHEAFIPKRVDFPWVKACRIGNVNKPLVTTPNSR